MARNARLEAILEGKFLSLQPDITFKERPLVVPVYDPQESTATPTYSKELAASVYPASSVYDPSEASSVTDMAFLKQAKGPQKPTLNFPSPSIRNPNERPGLDYESSHPPPYASHRRWPPRVDSQRKPFALRVSRRLSVTPTLLDAGYIDPGMTGDSSTDLSEIVSEQPGRISPMHVVKLPVRSTSRPPDSNTMVWLQVFAGFFVVMDA
ncbi:MAG: hypothetical protein Q9223_007910, partial [Gallowayella weberi]